MRRTSVLLALLVGAAACAGQAVVADPEVTTIPDASLPVAQSTPPIPATSLSTTSSTEPPPVTFPLDVSVAFLDGCVTEADLVASCRCALDGLAASVSADEVRTLEDDFAASGSIPPIVVEAFVDCAETEPVLPDIEAVRELAEICMGGELSREEGCRCAAERAVQIVPSADLDGFATKVDVDPSLDDLFAGCVDA